MPTSTERKSISCPACDASFSYPTKMEGQFAKCPKCDTPVRLAIRLLEIPSSDKKKRRSNIPFFSVAGIFIAFLIFFVARAVVPKNEPAKPSPDFRKNEQEVTFEKTSSKETVDPKAERRDVAKRIWNILVKEAPRLSNKERNGFPVFVQADYKSSPRQWSTVSSKQMRLKGTDSWSVLDEGLSLIGQIQSDSVWDVSLWKVGEGTDDFFEYKVENLSTESVWEFQITFRMRDD